MSKGVSSQQQVSALGWSFLGDMSRQGVTFLVSVILARILSPSDFGLVGMAMAFIVLLEILVEGGFSKALIQGKSVDALSYDSVFYFNIGVSVLVFFGLQVLAPVIGNFYVDDVVTDLVRWLAILVPINALGTVHRAVFTREMRFKELGIRTFLAGLLGGVVGVAMALYGWGVYALIGQRLTGAAISVAVLWRTAGWYPGQGGGFSLRRLLEMSKFGRYVFFSQITGRTITEIYTLFIGAVFSPATLGYFSRSQSLNQLVIRYTAGVALRVYLPVFSRIQDETAKFRALFFRIAGLMAWSTFLLTGILIIGAELIVITLFGEKWLPSVRIFEFFMLSFFNYPLNALLINALLSKGLADRNLYYGLLRSALRFIPLFVGWYYGFNAFLYAMVAFSYSGTFLNNWLISRDLGFSLSRQLKTFYGWAVLMVLGLLPTLWICNSLFEFWGGGAGARWGATSIAVAVYTSIYIIPSYWLKPELPVLADSVWQLIKKQIKRKK